MLNDPKPNTTQLMLPYFLTTLAITTTAQIAIALGAPTFWFLTIPTLIVAILYSVFLIRYRSELSRVRFGYYLAHALTFAVVNVPIAVSTFFRVTIRPAQGHDLQLTALVAMGCFWGIGLLLHSFGAIMGRGFEQS